MISNPLKIVLMLGGWLSLGLAILGIFLPILPTTPFVLLAAFCFSKSSSRLHTWLRQNRHFGQIISDWEHNQSIALKAKFLATSLIILLFSLSLFSLSIQTWLKASLIIIALSVLSFIWSRPNAPVLDKI